MPEQRKIEFERDDMVAETYRHWHAGSEKYTGGDALITALDNGWRIDGVIFRQEFWLAGVRRVCIFHVDLTSSSGEKTRMLVTQNPFITRFLHETEHQVVQINQRTMTDYNPLS